MVNYREICETKFNYKGYNSRQLDRIWQFVYDNNRGESLSTVMAAYEEVYDLVTMVNFFSSCSS